MVRRRPGGEHLPRRRCHRLRGPEPEGAGGVREGRVDRVCPWRSLYPNRARRGEPSMARNLYFIGTAGCGKSTMVRAFHGWLAAQGLDAVTVNLDPGAERTPYEVDIDVRDWIRLAEVMEEHRLGPNGAQVLA